MIFIYFWAKCKHVLPVFQYMTESYRVHKSLNLEIRNLRTLKSLFVFFFCFLSHVSQVYSYGAPTQRLGAVANVVGSTILTPPLESNFRHVIFNHFQPPSSADAIPKITHYDVSMNKSISTHLLFRIMWCLLKLLY